MIAVSIMIEGQQGLTWARWQRLAETVDSLPFAGMFRSDHFTAPSPPDSTSLETVVSLAWLASHTRHIHFGPMVSPVTFREPVMLARQAAAINNLSGGRMILGVGAGWQQREHGMYGYPLGDVSTRMARFEEGLEVITRLITSEELVTFEGRFFQLHDAVPVRTLEAGDPPTIMVGGNGVKHTLRLAARYAEVWNGMDLSPDEYRERSERLDEYLKDAGREPNEVCRTMMTSITFAKDSRDLDSILNDRRTRNPDHAGKSNQELLNAMRSRNLIVGTYDMVADQLAEYERAGVQEIMLQWFDMDDVDRLRAFGESLPARGV